MASLKDVQVGQTVRVTRLNGEGSLRRRIMDMGITRGIEIQVVKTAPLGDPMELHVRGYSLTLRRADAALIETE